MEINHFGDTILGVVTKQDIVEGRMVCLSSHSESYDFGSMEDLPGVRLPNDSTDSAKARYVITWPVDNRQPPIYETVPSYDYALRHGFDQDANAPFDATVHLTYPGYKEGRTIPSGSMALAFGEGIYTVPSGSYVYSTDIQYPGTQLEVCNTTDDSSSDSGKLKVLSAGTAVAEVVRYYSTDGRLTFKILH